jgi:hypothetical protein
MAETQLGNDGSDGQSDDDNQRIHPMQSLLDNPFLLLFIGVTVPTVFYTIWGIMEIAQIPLGL